MNIRQFFRLVVRPTLHDIGLASPTAEALVLGTALHESAGLTFIDQVTGQADKAPGPGLGVYQIEQPTHADVFNHFLDFPKQAALKAKVVAFRAPEPRGAIQLVTNLAYATAICRVIYYRVREPLPDVNDLAGLGRYWKDHYNTSAGKGTAEQWVASWQKYMNGVDRDAAQTAPAGRR